MVADANCEVRSAFLKSAQRSAQKNRPYCANYAHVVIHHSDAFQ